jgi:hypothetical protein
MVQKYLIEMIYAKVKNYFLGVPAEKAGGLYATIFFLLKKEEKGFSLQSLTQITEITTSLFQKLKNFETARSIGIDCR